MKTSFVLVLLLCCAYFFSCGDESLPPMDEILKLTLKDTANMKADGTYKFNVVAKIPRDVKDNYRTVHFTTNTGKFESSGNATVSAQVDSEGKASVSVVVGTMPGYFYINAEIGEKEPKFSVTERYRLLPVPTTDIINVEVVGAAEVVANGESIITINTTIKNTPVDNVTVLTTKGSFVNSGKETENSKVDQDGKSSFRLRVGTEAAAYFVTTSISEGIKVVSEISVGRAYADSLLAEPSSLIAGAKEAVDIAVFLKRKDGKVSLNTPISCTAYQTTGGTKMPVGRITGISEGSDLAGKIIVHFFADSQNIDPAKPITLEISTPQAESDPTPYTKTITLTYKEN